jgi:putative tricarboxylic transport membrane protein
VGFLIGILPGGAHIISTFVSYAIEKRLSRHPEGFGSGASKASLDPRRRTTPPPGAR